MADVGNAALKLQIVLNHLNSDTFDGKIEISRLGGFNDALAQRLGLALLQTTAEINLLSLPIGSMTVDPAGYPALLEYFRTANNLPVSLRISGDLVWDADGELSNPPTTSHETLDLLFSSIKQNEGHVPRIAINQVILGTDALMYLRDELQLIRVVLWCCSIDVDTSLPIPVDIARNTSRRWIAFCQNTTTTFLKLIGTMGLLDGFCGAYIDFGPKKGDHDQQVSTFINLIKQNRTIDALSFDNIDNDGTFVKEFIKKLAPLVFSRRIVTLINWDKNETLNHRAILRKRPDFLKAISQSLVWNMVFCLDMKNIFNQEQTENANKVFQLNLQIPALLEAFSEEYWTQNLWLLKRLLHPNLLAHPRYRSLLYQFLRRNFLVLQDFLRYHSPSSSTRYSQGPAFRTRLRTTALSARVSRIKSKTADRSKPLHDGPASRTRLRRATTKFSERDGHTDIVIRPKKKRRLMRT